MQSIRLKWALLALLVVLPGAAFAQCAGMSSGGHTRDAEVTSKPDEKDQRLIREILRDEGRRDLLLEAVFEDADFMQLVIDRIAQTSRLRRMVLESFGIQGDGEQPAQPDSSRSRQPRVKSDQKAPHYTCSMHPDVRSDKPGKCPKCGMNLERVEPSGLGRGNSPAKGT